MPTIRICAAEDAPLLSRMNRMLIEDERAENDMTIPQLEERMRGFLAGDYSAYLFEDGGETVGYALINRAATPLYLRQFFICRGFRGRGLGRAAFSLLRAEVRADVLDIDVYVWNETGRAFWRALGFRERAVNMRLRDDT